MAAFEYFQDMQNRELKRQENPPGQATETARPEKGPLNFARQKIHNSYHVSRLAGRERSKNLSCHDSRLIGTLDDIAMVSEQRTMPVATTQNHET